MLTLSKSMVWKGAVAKVSQGCYIDIAENCRAFYDQLTGIQFINPGMADF